MNIELKVPSVIGGVVLLLIVALVLYSTISTREITTKISLDVL